MQQPQQQPNYTQPQTYYPSQQQSPYPSQQQWYPQQPQVPLQWNQQQPPFQPQQYQTPMPPSKKISHIHLWIILAAVVLVLAVISSMLQYNFVFIILMSMMTCLSIPVIGVLFIVFIINQLGKSASHQTVTYQSASYYPTYSRHIRQTTKMKVAARDGAFCQHCGSEHNLEYDHIIPFSMGGDSDTANIQILCRSCNRSKGNRYSY